MCDICSALRPYEDECVYQDYDLIEYLGYGETWAEWFEAPNYAHGQTDVGFMTPNSTFDGAIGFLGDSDWLRIDLVQGTTYTIQMYSFSMETFLALADDVGNVLINDDFELVDYAGTTYAVSEFTVTATRTGTYYIIAEESGHNAIGAYTVGVVEQEVDPNNLEDWTLDEIAFRLTDSGWAFFNGERRSWDQDTVTYDISGLTNAVKPMVEHAFDAWAKVTGLTFVEVGSGGDITFVDDDAGKAYANSQLSGGDITSATINIATDFADQGTTLDSYVFQTFIHEIGHAIGLAHAGDYNAGQGGPTTYPDSVLFSNDSWNTSIMSYINQSMNTNDNADYALVMTPMIADIIAVQDLYGVPVQAYHGDTRYGVNSDTGDYMDDVFAALCEGDFSSSLINGGQPLSFTLWDTGGKDQINFSTDTQNQNVDLREEALSTIYGVAGAMVIGRDTEIEKYTAGSGDDTISGNNANNRIVGGDGEDQIKGRGGKDKLFGGKGDDDLQGGNGKDKLSGEKGDDKLTGGNKADVFVFGKGDDKDKIKDFENNLDEIELSSDLWSGSLSVSEVLDEFGSDKNGHAFLKFGNGDVLKVLDTTIDQLSNDLVIA